MSSGKAAKAESRLERAAIDAPHLGMREIARVALAKGLYVERLARAFAAVHPRRSINGQNVVQHLFAEGPHAATLDRYARALGLDIEYIELASGKPLPEGRIAIWRDQALQSLGDEEHLSAALVDEVKATWMCDPDSERSSLQSYALEYHREQSGLYSEDDILVFLEGLSVTRSVAALLESLRPGIKVASFVTERRVDYDANVFSVSNVLSEMFPEEDRCAIITIMRSLLSARGHNTIHPDNYYSEKLEKRAPDPGKISS